MSLDESLSVRIRALLRETAESIAGDGAWSRVISTTCKLRFTVGLTSLVILLLVPSAFGSRHDAFLMATVSVYLPYALIALLLSRLRTPAIGIVTLFGDIAVIFTVEILLPETHLAALFAYLTIAAYAAAVGGLRLGVLVAGLILAFVSALDIATARMRADTYTLLMFAVSLVAVIALMDAATRQQRRRDTRRAEMEVSALTHELRTPLTAVEGFARTLADRWDDLDSSTRHLLLDHIAANTDEMASLINHLVEYTRLGEWHAAATLLSLAEEVREFVDAHSPSFSRHVLRTDIDPSLTVYADAFALRRILGNLLANATKFSDRGTVVEVRAWAAGQEVVIAVADRGCGISPEDLPRIFHPFYRGAGGRVAGTGLGLTLVRRYAEGMGGRVWAEANPEGGAVLLFTLRSATSSELAG